MPKIFKLNYKHGLNTHQDLMLIYHSRIIIGGLGLL